MDPDDGTLRWVSLCLGRMRLDWVLQVELTVFSPLWLADGLWETLHPPHIPSGGPISLWQVFSLSTYHVHVHDNSLIRKGYYHSHFTDDTWEFPQSTMSKWQNHNSTPSLLLHGPHVQCSPLLPPALAEQLSLLRSLCFGGLLVTCWFLFCLLLPLGLIYFIEESWYHITWPFLLSHYGSTQQALSWLRKSNCLEKISLEVGTQPLVWSKIIPWRHRRRNCNKNCQTCSRAG